MGEIFVHDQFHAEEIPQVPDHGLLPRHPAHQQERPVDRLTRLQGVHDVRRDASAESVTDRLETVAPLLRVHEVRLGEYRTAGCDLRRRVAVGEGEGGQLPDTGQIEPARLLVQEAAGARGAEWIRLEAEVRAIGGEPDQPEPLTTRIERQAGCSRLAAVIRQIWLSMRRSERNEAGREGRRRNRPDPPEVELPQNSVQAGLHLAVGKLMEGADDFTVTIDFHRRKGDRACVQTEDVRVGEHRGTFWSLQLCLRRQYVIFVSHRVHGSDASCA